MQGCSGTAVVVHERRAYSAVSLIMHPGSREPGGFLSETKWAIRRITRCLKPALGKLLEHKSQRDRISGAVKALNLLKSAMLLLRPWVIVCASINPDTHMSLVHGT